MESLQNFFWFFAEDVVQTKLNYVVIEVFSILLKHDITKQIDNKITLACKKCMPEAHNVTNKRF